ncbi:hypothetical protein N4R57_09255 [Rhodobacteraceae bacterium D3-12]|nr:hypothetical protein N4R57_09255 [Rhodobacteraceae bacterium D3-12]
MTTVLRVAATISLFASLCWLLWPESLDQIFKEPEPIYVFFGALFAWLIMEIKSAHFEYSSKRKLPEADLEILKRFVVYHRGVLRELLMEHDLGAYIQYRYYQEIHGINHEVETKEISFHNPELARNFAAFAVKLKKFGQFLAQNSTPDLTAGDLHVRLDYKPRGKLPSVAQVGNDLANEAWSALEVFVSSALEKYADARAALPNRQFYHGKAYEDLEDQG